MGYFQGRGIALLVMVVSLCVSKGALATNYQVGDGQWTLQSYNSWLAGKTFKVGDTLEFVYASSQHNVVEVDKAEYGSCSAGNNTVYTDGDTKFTLSTTGTKYYICSVPTHCENGMKVAVTVEEASTTSPSPTTPSTPASTKLSPPPPPHSPSSSPISRPFLCCTLLLTLGISILFFKL